MYGHERTLVKDYNGRPFVLIGVNNDKELSRVKKAKKENNLNWRSFYDGKRGPICSSYGISAFPTIFLIDHRGEIRYKNVRGDKLDDAIEKLVEEAEAEGVTGGSEPTPKMREFSDKTGKYKILARLTGFESGNAILETKDGEEKRVPWGKLSLDDQRFVANYRLTEMDLARIAKQKLKFSFDKPIEFIDKTGDFSFEGTYITLYKKHAIIWDETGRETKVPWNKLSLETKELIKKDIKARK